MHALAGCLVGLPLSLVMVIPSGMACAETPGYTQGFYAAVGLSVGFGKRALIVDSSDSAFSNEYWKTSTTLGPNVGVGYGFG